MRGNSWPMVVVAVVVLAGCARPGDVQAGSPQTAPVLVSASAGPATPAPAVPVPAPASAIPVPAESASGGGASCARGAVPRATPPASFDVNDPRQRALRALMEQNQPTPRRGVVAEGAVPGAEACVHFLDIQFSLLAHGSRAVPAERAIDAALRSAGLTAIAVSPGPAFAASTGAACVYGTFTGSEPAFTIGPPDADGSCPA